MTVSAKFLPIGVRADATLMAIVAYGTFVLVFVLDAITPQTLFIEIVYEVSVVIAALSGSKKLIVRVLALTMLGDVFGCVVDAVTAGGPDPIAVENRVLSLISIFIVGALALSVRSKAETFGRADAQSSRQRLDGTLVKAMDRFWMSLQPAKIARVVTEEARLVFSAEETIWCPADANQPLLTSSGASSNEACERVRPALATEGAASLLRLLSLRSVETLPAVSALAGFNAPFGTPYYLAIPIASSMERYGVLLVSMQAQVATDEMLVAASQFALRALAAMQQTHLIEEVRMLNRALAAR